MDRLARFGVVGILGVALLGGIGAKEQEDVSPPGPPDRRRQRW